MRGRNQPGKSPARINDCRPLNKLLLDPATCVYPAHIYNNREFSTLGEEAEKNPRLQMKERADFIAQMRRLTLKDPDHMTEALPDPTKRIVVHCEYGRISTLATATLREMGFTRAVALDQGMQQWLESGGNRPLAGRGITPTRL